MLQFLSPIKWVGKSFAYREVGFVVFVTFLSHFWNYWWPLLAFDDLTRAFLETKMWQKCNRRKIFVSFFDTFLKWLLSHFKYIFAFCQFFVTIPKIFVRILSHFCFSKINYPFTICLQSFVTFLSVFCEFLSHFCHIFVIAGPTLVLSTKMIYVCLILKSF